MDDKVFQDYLHTIRMGHVPDNMSWVVQYCQKTTKEMSEFTQALTECVYRQNNQIKLLREIVGQLEHALRGKKLAEGEGKYDELSRWFRGAALAEMDNHRDREAQMLISGAEALMRLAEKGKEAAE